MTSKNMEEGQETEQGVERVDSECASNRPSERESGEWGEAERVEGEGTEQTSKVLGSGTDQTQN